MKPRIETKGKVVRRITNYHPNGNVQRVVSFSKDQPQYVQKIVIKDDSSNNLAIHRHSNRDKITFGNVNMNI